MLINMAKHLEQLDVSSLDALTQSIRQINQMMAEVRGIAFEVGAVERAFAELYPKLYDATVTSDRLAEDARTRFEHSVDAFEHTMRVQGQVVENVTSDVTEMASLVTASERAVGLLQAVQANNQLLALQTKQLVQVQDLMASQYRAESLELARSAAAEARASEQRRRFLGDGRAYSPAPVTAFRE
jgi:P-type conjugative transfer protein TrbJ